MTTLHDRLAVLAADADAPAPVSAGDLWSRGRRYHRLRAGGSTVIVVAAVLALVAVVGTSWMRASYDVQPAGPRGTLGLPDRLWNPSPWLPGTDETGPLGPLSAVVGAEHRSWTGSPTGGLVGVSSTGKYAFLDLPDLATTAQDNVALSPDGRYVGYWLTGDTTGTPNRFSTFVPVVGFAVYDTTTGEVRRHEVPTEHGLSTTTLVWAGQVLWAGFAQWSEGTQPDASHSASGPPRSLTWDLATDEMQEMPQRTPSAYGATSWGDSLVVSARRTVSLVDEAGTSIDLGRLDTRVQVTVALDPSGNRVAVLKDTDATGIESTRPKPLLVADTGTHGVMTTTRVPGFLGNVVMGWRDEGHVVVLRYGADAGYYSVDVTTGASEKILEPPRVNWEPGTLLAQDAWQAPTFEAPEPPNPIDPRIAWGGGIGVVVAGGGLLLLWRRRVRP
jgi:hypothetical protein